MMGLAQQTLSAIGGICRQLEPHYFTLAFPEGMTVGRFDFLRNSAQANPGRRGLEDDLHASRVLTFRKMKKRPQ
jgi:hypothetical protein